MIGESLQSPAMKKNVTNMFLYNTILPFSQSSVILPNESMEPPSSSGKQTLSDISITTQHFHPLNASIYPETGCNYEKLLETIDYVSNFKGYGENYVHFQRYYPFLYDDFESSQADILKCVMKIFEITDCLNHVKNDTDYVYANCQSQVQTFFSYTCYSVSAAPSIVCIPEVNPFLFENEYRLHSYIQNILTNSSIDIRVLDICDITLSHMMYVPVPLNAWKKDSKIYIAIHDEDSIRICLPLYKLFSQCTIGRSIAKCYDENDVVFLFHDDNCQQHVLKFLPQHSNENQLECFQKLCEGEYKITDIVVEGINVSLYPANKCNNFSLSLISHRFYYFNESFYMSFNSFWPCCYANHYVIWMQEPEKRGLNRHWSYLPYECRVGEDFLVAFITIITVIGLTGNIIVLSVMFSGGHRGEPSSLLRTSLSLADFSLCSVVMLPAVYNNYSLIKGSLNPELMYEMNFLQNEIVPNQSKEYYEKYTYTNGWFYVFQAHVLCLCSSAALITMFFLSLERFIITYRPLKYKTYFTLPRVKRGIVSSWAFGVVSLLALSLDEGVSVYWHGWTKLSFPIANIKKDFPPFKVISIWLCLISICTIILSMLSLLCFRREQAKVFAEWKRLDMRVTGNYESENRYIALSLITIASFYLATVVPVGISTFADNENNIDDKFPLLQYFSWWLFLSGSSSNPYVYNMRSHLFKSDMAEFFQKILPNACNSILLPCVKHSPIKVQNYLCELDELESHNGSHNGLPK
ncbi:hypothetical protein SK128_019098, partial [Halocaridina rubra]